MAIKLSFILPCYNVERYISDCLDSIYAQDMPEEEYEVICVNDCSTDNTCVIIEKYLQTHSNLKLIRHQRNMRVGIARNTGMKHAQGEYVCFVDADDLLPGGVMGKLYFQAFENDLDVLLYNDVVLSEGEFCEEPIMYTDSCVVSGGDFIEKYLQGNIGKIGSPWAKLFNRMFLLQHSIWYSNLVYSEDAAFTWETMICAKRVKSVSEIGYIYRVNDFSFSANKKKPYIVFTSTVLYPEVLIAIMDKYGDKVPALIRRGIVNEIKTVVNNFGTEYLSFEEEGRKELYYMVREKRAPVFRLGEYMNRKQKTAFLMRKMGFGIFNAVVKGLFSGL